MDRMVRLHVTRCDSRISRKIPVNQKPPTGLWRKQFRPIRQTGPRLFCLQPVEQFKYVLERVQFKSIFFETLSNNRLDLVKVQPLQRFPILFDPCGRKRQCHRQTDRFQLASFLSLFQTLRKLLPSFMELLLIFRVNEDRDWIGFLLHLVRKPLQRNGSRNLLRLKRDRVGVKFERNKRRDGDQRAYDQYAERKSQHRTRLPKYGIYKPGCANQYEVRCFWRFGVPEKHEQEKDHEQACKSDAESHERT